MIVTLSRRSHGDEFAVGVASPDVHGVALWCGRGDPVVETPIDVELDVPDVISWGDVAIESSGAEAPVPASDELLISGVVERPDEDGVAVVRVGDSTVLVETAGPQPAGVIGERVTLLARGVGVYPTGT